VRLRQRPLTAVSGRAGRPSLRLPPGTRFLLAKRREQDARRRSEAGANHTALEVFARLSRIAGEACRKPAGAAAPGWRAVLDAAFLVDAGRAGLFRAEAHRLGRRLAAGYRLELSGPWPAYNFVQ
jgi:hypothetical protein